MKILDAVVRRARMLPRAVSCERARADRLHAGDVRRQSPSFCSRRFIAGTRGNRRGPIAIHSTIDEATATMTTPRQRRSYGSSIPVTTGRLVTRRRLIQTDRSRR